MNFIKTSDIETAVELRKLGFQELPKENSFFVFVNKPDQYNFASNKKIIQTNKLSI